MIELIEKIVCQARKVNCTAIHSKSRERELVESRQIVMFFTREMNPKMTFYAIGSFYGKDHATCMHAIKVINNRIETDREFKNEIEFMRLQIDFYFPGNIRIKLGKERKYVIAIIKIYRDRLKELDETIGKIEIDEMEKAAKFEAKSIVSAPLINDYTSPFQEIESSNNLPYHGFRNHSL